MSALSSLVRGRVTVVWSLLVLATIVSWLLGTGGEPGSSSGHELASIVIVLVAFIKVRLIGMYFMELRHAPAFLRRVFDAYCLVVCSVVLGMFLLV